MTRISAADMDSYLQDEQGNTRLTQAVLHNDIETAKTLLGLGANPHMRNTDGRTAMDYILNTEMIDPKMKAVFVEWAQNQYIPDPNLEKLRQLKTYPVGSTKAPLNFSSKPQMKVLGENDVRSRL